MTRRKAGLILFWVGLGYAFLCGVAVSAFGLVPAWKTLTMDGLRQTTWAFYDDDDLIVPELGTGMILWTTSIQLGALVAGIGLLLRSGARGSTIWGFGTGLVLVSIIPMGMVVLDHIPAFFSIGGTLILALFFGLLWLWAKERIALKDSSTAAADFRLAGYVCMAIASWYVCGLSLTGFVKVFEGQPLSIHAFTSFVMLSIMVWLALGWLFLFLSHVKSRQQQASAG